MQTQLKSYAQHSDVCFQFVYTYYYESKKDETFSDIFVLFMYFTMFKCFLLGAKMPLLLFQCISDMVAPL